MAVKWKNPKTAAKDAEKKYETMNYLLYQFGVNNLTKEQFWGQMKQRGWDQPDIDAWCVEYYQRSADEDAKQEAKRQERNGAARATASRDARGPRGESGLVGPRGSHDARQEADRQGDARQATAQGRAAEGGEAQRSWPVGEVLITLDQKMIDWVDIESRKAAEKSIEEEWRRQGGQPDDVETQLREAQMGGRGEAAVRRWIGKLRRWRIQDEWSKRETGKRKPDFGDDIDVKTVYYERAQLWLTPNCEPEYIYILVSCNLHPTYRIIGWCYGADVMFHRTIDYWNPDAPRDPAWVVNQGDPILRSPHLLFEMLEERVR